MTDQSPEAPPTVGLEEGAIRQLMSNLSLDGLHSGTIVNERLLEVVAADIAAFVTSQIELATLRSSAGAVGDEMFGSIAQVVRDIGGCGLSHDGINVYCDDERLPAGLCEQSCLCKKTAHAVLALLASRSPGDTK